MSSSKIIRVPVPLTPFVDRQVQLIPSIYTCNKCSGVIETVSNNYTKYKKNVYHKHCLTCNYCSTELKGSFIFKNSEFYCLNCASSKLKDIISRPTTQKWISTSTNAASGSGIKRSPVPESTVRARTQTKIGGPRMEQQPMSQLSESKSIETIPPISDSNGAKPTNEATSQRERTATNWNFSKSQVIAKGSTIARPVISRVRGPNAADSPVVSRKFSNPRSNDQEQKSGSDRLKPIDEVERLLKEGREKLQLEQQREEQEEAERERLLAEQLKSEKEKQKAEQIKRVQEEIDRKRKELDDLVKLQNQNFELEMKQQKEESEKRRYAAEEKRKQEAERQRKLEEERIKKKRKRR